MLKKIFNTEKISNLCIKKLGEHGLNELDIEAKKYIAFNLSDIIGKLSIRFLINFMKEVMMACKDDERHPKLYKYFSVLQFESFFSEAK